MDTLSQHKLVDSKLRSNNNGEARYSCAPRTKLCLISAPGLLNQQTCTTLYYSFAYYTFCWAVQRWHTTLFEIPAFLLNEAVHEVGEAAIFRSNNTLPWIPTVIYRKIYLIAHAWKRHYDVISKNNLVDVIHLLPSGTRVSHVSSSLANLHKACSNTRNPFPYLQRFHTQSEVHFINCTHNKQQGNFKQKKKN